MKILGFNSYGHDSAAALIINNEIVFAVEEERLNRKKHAGGFPETAIRACLDYEKITIDDLDHVAFFWNPTISLSKIPVYLLKFWDKVPILLREQRSFEVEENLGMLNYLLDMYKLPKKLKGSFQAQNPKFKFHFLEHHLCHAASAFFPSPFEESAILTIDGAGEWATTLLAEGKGNNIRKIQTVNTPYSLGAFYQAVSIHLGFKLIEGPGKMMGLASYGNPDGKVYEQMKKLFRLKENGGFDFDMSYFSYHYTRKSGVSEKFTKLFGESKKEGKDWTEHELEVAAAAQHIVEDVVMHMAKHLKKVTKSNYLCMAGGVALNSVTNGIIAKSGLFKDIFIQPAAGDSGTAIGAALLLNHQKLNQSRKTQETAFLGPKYDNETCLKAIEKAGLPYRIAGDEIYNFTAEKLMQNKIIAWFQGRMEFGPRALGNRSILANPMDKDMKDILNKRVKFREAFRPFAAIVTEEDCETFFDHDYPNPYMLLVYNVREKYRSIMPSLTHVDGTVRIQTVNENENAPMKKLLKTFETLSGYPVLINTSFNIKGEPIVCTPQDAVRSFANADMDYLILNDIIVWK
ncbi:carbamoyltransferase N-terminal domain-containing protein [Lacihabitans sp. CS3-21]|uniref:carbamoyltransferase family protein n=1 Tax=Lacihabitans sp. CS3-21 TaxID=2487332 RepID=UPI0020CFCCF3|nr:carbamoyltransferase N-terminal domain-containing protein [Lacihabitans sp. CS3-21]MCP9748226.1 carbamoyl transferase [Lacihabitans sp. CS3-21]